MGRGLFFAVDRLIEVTQGVIEVVHLKVEQSSEEVKTGFFVLRAAIGYGFVHEPLGLEHLLKLNLLIDEVAP